MLSFVLVAVAGFLAGILAKVLMDKLINKAGQKIDKL